MKQIFAILSLVSIFYSVSSFATSESLDGVFSRNSTIFVEFSDAKPSGHFRFDDCLSKKMRSCNKFGMTSGMSERKMTISKVKTENEVIFAEKILTKISCLDEDFGNVIYFRNVFGDISLFNFSELSDCVRALALSDSITSACRLKTELNSETHRVTKMELDCGH